MGVCLGSDGEGQVWSERQREASTEMHRFPGSQAAVPQSWKEWAVTHQQVAVFCGPWHGANSSSPLQDCHVFRSRESLLLNLPFWDSLGDGQPLGPISCQPPRKPRPIGSFGVNRKACSHYGKQTSFFRRPLAIPLVLKMPLVYRPTRS